MKLLALIIVIVGWLLLLSLLRIELRFYYFFQSQESKMTIDFKLLAARLKVDINIPRDRLSAGIMNIFGQVVKDVTEERGDEGREAEPVKQKRPGTKTKRYRSFKNSLREILRHYVFSWARLIWIKRQLSRLRRAFYSKVNVHYLNTVVHIGGRDASETGLLTGACWAFFGQMTARLYRLVTVRKNNISYEVIPFFDQEIFLCRFNCILSLKISHIIFTAYKFLLFILKNRRIRNYGRASD